MTTCALCGLEFTASDVTCGGCPLGAGCTLVCCPRCGYQVPDESQSRVVALLRSTWRALARSGRGPARDAIEGAGGSDGSIPLTALRPGQSAEVISMSAAGRSWQERLASFGIVAGTSIELVQHRPTPIIRAGHTSLALDGEIAQGIRVRRSPDACEHPAGTRA
jgi:Fe2+ transport system protein FeoA